MVVYLTAELITALTSLFITLRHPSFIFFDIALCSNGDCRFKDLDIDQSPRNCILMMGLKSVFIFEVVVLLKKAVVTDFQLINRA